MYPILMTEYMHEKSQVIWNKFWIEFGINSKIPAGKAINIGLVNYQNSC